MFDIGWSELLVIAVVLIVVVGPKDLPPMLRTFGKTMTRFRKMAGEFRAQFDEALREADLDDVRQTIADAQKLNPAHSLREAMNPLRQMGNDIKADLQRSTIVERAAEPQTPAQHDTPALAADPLSVAAPTPVIAPAPEAIAETIAKPRAPRKPRVKTEALDVQPSVPVVTEVLSTSKAARKPRARAEGRTVEEPSVIEPAQVGLPVEKPKRTSRKPAVSAAAEVPPATSAEAAPDSKKDDA